MRRRGKIGLALGLAVWLLLIVAVWRSEDLAAGAAAEQALSDNGYQIASAFPLVINDSGQYVRLGALYWDEATGHLLLCSEGASDCPSGVPVTPEPGPSATPPPTNTPRPPAEPSPTPESTALPTLPPDDQEKLCLVKVRGTAINERTGPGVSYPKTTTSPIPAGSTVKVLEVRPGSGDNYLWGRNAFGWFVLREGTSWWVDGLEGATELCVDVPGWPAGLAPPAPIARAPMVGWTVTPGASRDALLLAGRELQAAGITPTATVTSDHETASVLHDNGWYVVVRLWTIFPGDCPDMSLPPATSARLRIGYLARQHGGARFDAAQLSNECAWPSATYLRDWLIAAVDECDARGWTCIPTVFNTGAPELDWLPVLRPALQMMHAHHHLLGYNAYPYDAGRMLCEDSEYTSYTTFRWRRFADFVPAGELPPIYLTEAARGDGAREPALEDVVCFADEVKGDVIGLCYWYAGVPLAPWQAAAWSSGQLLIGAQALAAALR